MRPYLTMVWEPSQRGKAKVRRSSPGLCKIVDSPYDNGVPPRRGAMPRCGGDPESTAGSSVSVMGVLIGMSCIRCSESDATTATTGGLRLIAQALLGGNLGWWRVFHWGWQPSVIVLCNARCSIAKTPQNCWGRVTARHLCLVVLQTHPSNFC